MRRLLALIIAITSIALVSPVLAQPGSGANGGMEPGAKHPSMNPRALRSAAQVTLLLMRLYNPKTITTVTGGVESLGTLPPKSQVEEAIRSAVLKTEQGKITVYLGPDWYLNEQKIALKAGDQVEVTGSKTSLAKGLQPAVIVRDLKVAGKSVSLRDAKGVPTWLEGRPGGPAAK